MIKSSSMQAIHKTANAVIDLAALVHNFHIIKEYAPHSKVLAVLKANAYGHGFERIAQALIGSSNAVDAFGVARIDEALALRAEGITTPIVLLEGIFNPEDVNVLAQHNFQTIVHNHIQLETILNATLEQPIHVWLKVDTGMHRLGVDPSKFEYFYQALKNSKNVAQELVVISHLGCADEPDNPATLMQYHAFEAVTENLPVKRSLANSAAICAFKQTHYEWVRPGLMLYGVSPLVDKNEAEINLKPVMTLYSSLIAIRDLKAGEAVGYGGSWKSTKNTTIGVVAIGYGDGYPRHAQAGTPVYINGRIVPLVGRVSMDMITVDLGLNYTESVGDEVILWGKSLPVAKVAEKATTIPYELLCNITRRVKVAVI